MQISLKDRIGLFKFVFVQGKSKIQSNVNNPNCAKTDFECFFSLRHFLTVKLFK